MAEQSLSICPDCRSGKHVNCTGEAWNTAADMPVACECPECEVE